MKGIDKSKVDEPFYSPRAQEIIDQAIRNGAQEGELDCLYEGGAEMQADAEVTAKIVQWVQNKRSKV